MKTIRSLTPEIRVINDADGTCDFIASDQTLDSYKEIIRAAGWKFDLFAKNSPLVDSHDYHSIDKQLGSILSWEIRDGKLHERAKFAIDVPENALARLAWGMIKGGYLRAVSVGFFPVKYHWRGDDDFAQAAEAMKLDTSAAAACRCIYWEQQQIELSVCVIGANPNALLKARSDKAITDDDLHAAGLASDDALSFMTTAANVWDTGDELLRHGVTSIMARFHRDRAAEISGKGTRAPVGARPDATTRARQEKQREQDQTFLARLESLAKKI